MKSLSATNSKNINNNQRHHLNQKYVSMTAKRPKSTSITPINFDLLFKNLNLIDDYNHKKAEISSNFRSNDQEEEEDDEETEIFDYELDDNDDILNDSLNYVKRSSTNNKRHTKTPVNTISNSNKNNQSKKQRRRLKLNKLENNMHIGASVLLNEYSQQLGLFSNMKLPMSPSPRLNSTPKAKLIKSNSNLNDYKSYSDYAKLVQGSSSLLKNNINTSNNDNKNNNRSFNTDTKLGGKLKFKTFSANFIQINQFKQQQLLKLKSQSAPNKKFMNHYLTNQLSNDSNNNNINNTSISEDDSLENTVTNSFIEIKTIDELDQDENTAAVIQPEITRRLSRQQQRFSKTGSDLNVIEFFTDLSSHSSTNRRSNRQPSIKASNKKITFLKISKVSS
jgi:hypothetical protein